MSCTSFCVYTLLVIIWFSRFLYRIFALYRNKIVDNVRQNVVNPTLPFTPRFLRCFSSLTMAVCVIVYYRFCLF